jgi:hypothetical protein
MLNIIRNHVEEMATMAISSYINFIYSEVREVLKKSTAYGKKDTLGLDAITEIVFIERVAKYDNQSILVTEETDELTRQNLPDTYNPKLQPLAFISDPMDRTKQMEEFLFALLRRYLADRGFDCKDMSDKELLIIDENVTVRELWKHYDVTEEWEAKFEKPATITGATSAISCVFRGEAIASAIVNLISSKLILACELGIYHIDIKRFDRDDRIILEDICCDDDKLDFPFLPTNPSCAMVQNGKLDYCRRFVTFIGKSGYPEHFENSKILLGKSGIEDYLHHKAPGGPSRILYLSSLQIQFEPIGFILGNGEKITEWVHWLPFIKFARTRDGSRVLRAFEAFTEQIMQKEGIPMSVSPSLSIFRKTDRFGNFLNISKIGEFKSPSHFRSMIAVCHHKNSWLASTMKLNGYREISSYF